MSFIQVTASMLKERAEELRSLNARYSTEIETLNNAQINLSTMWEGEANKAFVQAFMKDKGQMDAFRNAVDQYIVALITIASRYEDAEAKNMSLASIRT